jgi:hypothetical protein
VGRLTGIDIVVLDLDGTLYGRCCIAPTQGVLKHDLARDQIAKASSSNATATRRFACSSGASS